MDIKASDTFGWSGNAWRNAFQKSALIREVLERKK